jgi:hypothetical protein
MGTVRHSAISFSHRALLSDSLRCSLSGNRGRFLRRRLLHCRFLGWHTFLRRLCWRSLHRRLHPSTLFRLGLLRCGLFTLSCLLRSMERRPTFLRGVRDRFPGSGAQFPFWTVRLGSRLHRRPTCPLGSRDPFPRRRAHRSLSRSRFSVSNWSPMIQLCFKVRDSRFNSLLLSFVSDQRHRQQMCICA